MTKSTAIWCGCGGEETMTQRLVNGVTVSRNDPVVLVGASESYESRCSHCHVVKD